MEFARSEHIILAGDERLSPPTAFPLKADDDAAPVEAPLLDGGTAAAGFPEGRQRWGINVHFNWRPCCRDACANHSVCNMHAGDDMPMLGPAFGSARMDISWSHVETHSRGVYDWSATGYEAYAAQLLAAEPPVVPYFVFSYGNALYDNDCPAADKHDGTCPPTSAEGREGFVNFTLATMRHFQGKGILWEVWNEPNGGTWLPHTNPPGQDYAKLLLAVGAARDAAGLRDELLLGPATAVDMPFIETVARAGCFAHLDGLSVHPYRDGGPESVLHNWDDLNALIDKYYVPSSRSGSRRPKLVSGEWGWASCTDGAGSAAACTSGGGVGMAVSQAEQAARLVRQRYVNDLAGVAHSIYYDWQDDGPDAASLDSENNFGTLEHALSANGSRVPKPAYLAALASTNLLGSCAFDTRLRSSAPESFALAYVCRGHKFVLTAWDPSLYNASAKHGAVRGIVSAVTVPPGQAGRCFDVLDMYGNRLSDQVCAGRNGSEVNVELRSEPRYLVPAAAFKADDGIDLAAVPRPVLSLVRIIATEPGGSLRDPSPAVQDPR